MELQTIKITDEDGKSGIEFDIESEQVLMKLIEMVTICTTHEMLIKQVDGYVIIKDLSVEGHRYGKRHIMFRKYNGVIEDGKKPSNVYVYYGCYADLLGNHILKDIDVNDLCVADDDCCEMSWIDDSGLHIMVDCDRSIAVTNSKRTYYNTYISSNCEIGNTKYKNFNGYIGPIYDEGDCGNGWDEYLVSYNENNPILSTATLVRNHCQRVTIDHKDLNYFIDDCGRPWMAFISGKNLDCEFMSDTFSRMTEYNPDGETLYRIGDEDDYDMYDHIIVLHYNPKEGSSAEYVYKDEFYKKYGN